MKEKNINTADNGLKDEKDITTNVDKDNNVQADNTADEYDNYCPWG